MKYICALSVLYEMLLKVCLARLLTSLLLIFSSYLTQKMATEVFMQISFEIAVCFPYE